MLYLTKGFLVRYWITILVYKIFDWYNWKNVTLMYTTYHIFLVLPIKYLINKDGDPATPHKLATGTKPSVYHLRVLLCPCVVHKATAHVDTNMLSMRHQAQKGFCGNFFGIPEHQKRYLVYVSSEER